MQRLLNSTSLTGAAAGELEQVGRYRFRAIAASSQLARDRNIVVVDGMDIGEYLRYATVLEGHNPGAPVASCVEIAKVNGNLPVCIEFPPFGESPRADECAALVRSGVYRALSIGFDPIDMEPLDPRNKYGGQRITRSTLLEISIVSVPADVNCLVTQRSRNTARMFRTMMPIPRRTVRRAFDHIRNSGAKEKLPSDQVLRENVRRLGEIGARHAREFGCDRVDSATLEEDVRRLGAIGKQYARELDYLRGNSRTPHEAAPVRGPQIGRARTNWSNQG